jgi:hypothetical protein
LADRNNVNQVGLTADSNLNSTNIGILRKGKYVWTATAPEQKKKHVQAERRNGKERRR